MPMPPVRVKKILNDDEIYSLRMRGHTPSQIAVIVSLPLKEVSDALEKEQIRRSMTVGIVQR